MGGGRLIGLLPTSKDSADLRAAAENPKRGTGKGPRQPELVGAMEAEGSAQDPDVPSKRSVFKGI